jgi:hypothetical protein
MKEFLMDLGFNIGLAMSGLLGSLVTIWRSKKKMNVKEQALSMIAGTLSANYLTPLVISFMDLKDNTQFGVAFVVGFGGLKAVEYVYDKYFTKQG